MQYETAAKWMNLDGSFSSPSEVMTFPVAIPASAKGQSNFTVDRIIGNTDSSSSVTISCKDASGHVIASTTVANVRCYENQKTVLSGNLFTANNGQAPQTFVIKVDTAWNSTVNHQGF
jgi:hypothetical protein